MRRFSFSSRLWIVIGFFLIAFAVFGQTLHNEFVMWDDTYLIYANPDVKGFSVRNIINAFSTYDPELYIPLTLLSYQLDYTIAGMNPAMFHFTNLFLHTLNALLVCWLLGALARRKDLAIFGGLLFLLHPLNVEAFAWASARKDVLSTFFFLLSIIGYLHYRESHARLPYYGSLLAFVLALLSKAMVVTLPVVLLLLDWREGRKIERQYIVEKIPYFLLSILFGIIALFGKRDVVAESTTFEKILMAAKSTLFYMEKFFVPHNLNALYPWNGPIELSSPAFFVPALLVALCIAGIVFTVRNTRNIAFGAAFFLLTLMPTFTNFAKGGELYIASDRYAYIPMIGLLFLLLLAVDTYIIPRVRQFSLALGMILLLVCAALSFKQTHIWADTFTLFEDTMRLYPDAMSAKINLGVAYRKTGDLKQSEEMLQLALAQRPHARAMTALAAVYLDQNRINDAIELCRKAQLLDARDPEPTYGLALAYAKAGDAQQAKAAYEQTIALEPKHIAAYNNLAALYLQEGNTDEAIRHFTTAMELDPSFPDAPYNLGLIYEEKEDFVKAADMFEKAAALQPKDTDALMKLASSYAQLNDREHTIRTLQKILAIDPSHAFAKKLLEAVGIR